MAWGKIREGCLVHCDRKSCLQGTRNSHPGTIIERGNIAYHLKICDPVRLLQGVRLFGRYLTPFFNCSNVQLSIKGSTIMIQNTKSKRTLCISIIFRFTLSGYNQKMSKSSNSLNVCATRNSNPFSKAWDFYFETLRSFEQFYFSKPSLFLTLPLVLGFTYC